MSAECERPKLSLRPSRSIDLLRRPSSKLSAGPDTDTLGRSTLKRSKSSAFLSSTAVASRASPTSAATCATSASFCQNQLELNRPGPKKSKLARKASTLFSKTSSHTNARFSKMSSAFGLRTSPLYSNSPTPTPTPPAIPPRPDSPLLSPQSPNQLAHILEAPFPEFPFPKQTSPRKSKPPPLQHKILRRAGDSTRTESRISTASSESSTHSSLKGRRRPSWLPRVFGQGSSGSKPSPQNKRVSSTSIPSSLRRIEMASGKHLYSEMIKASHSPVALHWIAHTATTPSAGDSPHLEPVQSSPASPHGTVNSEEECSGWSSVSSDLSPKRYRGPRALGRKLSRGLSKSFDNLRAMSASSSLNSSFAVIELPPASSADSSLSQTSRMMLPTSDDPTRLIQPRRRSADLYTCRSATTELASLVSSLGRTTRRGSIESYASRPASHFEGSSFTDGAPDQNARSLEPRTRPSSRGDQDEHGGLEGLRRLRRAPDVQHFMSQEGHARATDSLESSWGSSFPRPPADDSARPSYETNRTSVEVTRSSLSSCDDDHEWSVYDRKQQEGYRPSVGDRMLQDIGRRLYIPMRNRTDYRGAACNRSNGQPRSACRVALCHQQSYLNPLLRGTSTSRAKHHCKRRARGTIQIPIRAPFSILLSR